MAPRHARRASGGKSCLPPRHRAPQLRYGSVCRSFCSSNPDQVNFDQRPLAEAFIEDAAQSSARRVAHRFVVPPQARRQFVERPLQSTPQRGTGCFSGGWLDHADHADSWRREGLAATIQHQGGNGSAVENDAAAILQRRAVEWQETFAVAGEPPNRHLVDNAGAARREPDHVAVLNYQWLLDLALAGEFGVRD